MTPESREDHKVMGPQGLSIPGASQSWYRSSARNMEYGVPHMCTHMPSTYIWDHGLDSKTSGHQALLIWWPTGQRLWSGEGERPAFAKQLLSQFLGQAQRTGEKKLLIISLSVRVFVCVNYDWKNLYQTVSSDYSGEMMVFFFKSCRQQFSADNNLSSVFHILSEAQSHHLKFIKHANFGKMFLSITSMEPCKHKNPILK